MMKLALYPEYKDSGVPWLEKIPVHWAFFRKGRLFSQRNETGFGGLPILEVSLNIINEAVTRGLDPNVKFKPSGVEWIGDIPEHWAATKLKRVVSFNSSKSET